MIFDNRMIGEADNKKLAIRMIEDFLKQDKPDVKIDTTNTTTSISHCPLAREENMIKR